MFRTRPSVDSLEARRLFATVTGYLPDYHFGVYNKLDYGTLDTINYFSLKPTLTGRLPGTDSGVDSNRDGVNDKVPAVSSNNIPLTQLTTLVNYAHDDSRDVKVNIVIGGAGANDDTLDRVIANPDLHDDFAASVNEFVQTCGVDGIDLDWEEYDTTHAQIQNYAALIDTLRNNTDGLFISAAVYSEGVNVAEFDDPFKQLTPGAIQDLNQINVMAYDYDPAAGNHSPAAATQSAMNSWAYLVSNSRQPKSKLVYGLPFYGRHGPGYGYELSYADIIAGYQRVNGVNAWPAANVDSITFGGNTWGFNGRGTIQAKTEFARTNNFGGVMIWDLGHDIYTGNQPDPTYSLMAAIRRGLGNQPAPSTGTITGKVTVGTSAMSGMQIYIDADNDGTMDTGESRTLSDQFGQYTFSNVPVNPDVIVRQVGRPGYQQVTPANNYGRHANVKAGQTTANVNFNNRQVAAAQVGTVTGNVTSSGNPMNGVVVFYDADNDRYLDEAELRTSTNASGVYSLANVPAGSGRAIRMVIPSGYFGSPGDGNIVTLSAGQTVGGKNFTLTPVRQNQTATINGTVFNDKNGNGVQNSGETGFNGWKVFIDSDNDGLFDQGEKTVNTNSSGAFSLTSLAAGTHKIRVIKPTGYVQTIPTQNYGRTITVATGQTVGGVLFGARQV